MNKLLTGKVALTAGSSVHIISSVVQTLLQEGATAIVAAKSAREISSLKEFLAGTDTVKLVTLLTDYPDYDKVVEISESITEQFGSIDIAVMCFDAVNAAKACNIIDTDIIDWEKMIDKHITAYFVGARVLLGSMKKYSKGMFVSIMDFSNFDSNNYTPVAELTSGMQERMAEMFFEEAKKYNIKCFHLSLTGDAGLDGSGTSLNSENKLSNNPLGDFIVHLYNGSGDESLFQKLKLPAHGLRHTT